MSSANRKLVMVRPAMLIVYSFNSFSSSTITHCLCLLMVSQFLILQMANKK